MAQGIALVATPFVTRLYGPESFGILGTFMALIGFLMPLSALSYPMAIVLPSDDEHAFGLVRLSLVIGLVSSLAVEVMLLMFGQYLAANLQLEPLRPFFAFIPPAMFLSAALAALNYWTIRKKLFTLNATITVIHAAFLNGSKAGLGLIAPMPGILIGSTVGAWIAQATLLACTGELRGMLRAVTSPSRWLSAPLAYRYRDFPLYRAPQLALNTLSTSAPTLLMASFFGIESAGYYALGATVLAAPLTLIGRSVGDSLYPRINDCVLSKKPIAPILLHSTKAIALVALVPFALVVIAGPWLFAVVFGADWRRAGLYSSWMAVWLFFALMNRPAMAAIPVLRVQKSLLGYEIATLILRGCGLFIGFHVFHSDVIAVAVFSCIGAVVNAGIVVAVLTIAFKRDSLPG